MKKQTDDLPPKLAAPARRALAGAGILCLDELTSHTEVEIAALHGIGRNALEQLRQAMSDRGIAFAAAE